LTAISCISATETGRFLRHTSSVKDTLTIDFNGAYGLQRGIYWVNEQRGELTMIVADPGVKRPVDIGAVDSIGKKGRTSNFVRYVLQKAD
jgi:hypothetical protein